jgi:hypothetical protein
MHNAPFPLSEALMLSVIVSCLGLLTTTLVSCIHAIIGHIRATALPQAHESRVSRRVLLRALAQGQALVAAFVVRPP